MVNGDENQGEEQRLTMGFTSTPSDTGAGAAKTRPEQARMKTRSFKGRYMLVCARYLLI